MLDRQCRHEEARGEHRRARTGDAVTVKCEVLLRGGRVVDGTGAPPFRADVGVHDGAVTMIGRMEAAQARTELDVTGCLVLPGLVDTHVHADAVLDRPQTCEAMLAQGITSVVLGQDGVSFAPSGPETMRFVRRYFAAINGQPWPEWESGVGVGQFLDSFERRTPINVGYLVPLGTVRHEAVGPDRRPATPAELRRMIELVEDGLAQGAAGVSTGLEYVPGLFADVDELAALCEPAARAGRPYVSHLRSYADGRAPGMGEARELAERTGVPIHVSHYRGQAEPLLAHLEGARSAGVDVTFDSYPHLYANTILAMKALPPAIQEGGVDATLRRLDDATVRDELARDWFPGIEQDLAPTILGFVAGEPYRWTEGLTVGEAAERADQPLAEFVCTLLRASELAVGCIVPMSRGGGERDVRALLRDEAHMGCSDGIYLGGHPHPRGWGAFGAFLGRHTRELGDWTWGQASVHLSSHPARRFGLGRRGLVRTGYVADLAVIDPATVGDRATYDEPRRLAAGVRHVLVGGELAWSEGALTGATPGRALRREEH